MIAIPTTLVTILGGVSTSPFEDSAEGAIPVTTNVPASIVESRQIVATESDPANRIIRFYTGRLPNGTAVDNTQRILDQTTGDVYVIDNVSVPRNPIVEQDVRLDLRRVE